MEAQYRNAVDVHNVRIDIGKVLRTAQNLTKYFNCDRSDSFTDPLLVLLAEARGVSIESAASRAFITVAAQKILASRAIGQVTKSRHVNAAGPVGPVDIGCGWQVRKLTLGASSGDMVHQIVAQDAAGIGQAVRVLPIG